MNEALRVSATSKPVMVAGAIAATFRQHRRVEVHAIGPAAINQAIKAVAIARGYVLPNGDELVCIPSFVNLAIAGEECVGIRLLVEAR